jgi:hypothetical protein
MPVESAEPWYPLRVGGKLTMRRHNKQVEITWGHYIGPALFVGPPVQPRAQWMQPKAGKLEVLPPRKMRIYRNVANGEDVEATDGMLDRNGWGTEPTAWRPMATDKWPDELPAPLTSMSPTDGRAVRVDHIAFNAVEAAAEMEAERQWRRDRGDDGDDVSVDAWWRDGTLITYSEPGSITPREVEGRVLRGLYWLGRGGDTLRASTNSALASMVAESLSSEHMPEGGELPALARMPHETDERLLEAMAWVTEMIARSRYAKRWLQLLLRLCGDNRVTIGAVGSAIGVSADIATRLRQTAIRHLTEIANHGTQTMQEKRARIVAGNRSHHASVTTY